MFSRTLLAVPFLASISLARQAPDQKPPAPPRPAQEPLGPDTRVGTNSAPAAAKSPGLDSARAHYRLSHEQLYLSSQADGSPQVRGRTYKAEFTPGGATYIPFCGSAAPHNHPLSFRIESITAGAEPVAFANEVTAVLDGQTVRYARGGVTEVYALALDSIEQEFVFDALPATGELVVRLACTSDMRATREGDALFFSSADGTLRYGAATVVDANGAKRPAATELDGDSIVLRVPAEFLATAAFPVTLDPVISTFSVSWFGTGPDDFAPAMAWDESNQRYCVVYEEVYSASDHDVISLLLSPTGVMQSGGYVDGSLSAYWANPDVANNNSANQFFIVAEVGLPASGARTIHGRTQDAASAVLGSDLDVSTGTPGEKLNASVGGDPFLGTSYYTVVWERVFTAGFDDDIHMRQVTTGGALLGTGSTPIDNTGSTLDKNPRISKSCQQAGTHHVVWERWQSASDSDVLGAEVSWAGTITLPTTLLVTGATASTLALAPACSPIDNSGYWLLVYEVAFPSDHDVYGRHMSGLTSNDWQDLSSFENELGSGTLWVDQRSPAADTDGNHFTYSYSEQFGSSASDYDVYVATADFVGSTLMVGEYHRNLAYSTTHENYPAMCSQQAAGGSGNRVGIVWSDTGGTNLGDIEGALYETSDYTKLCTASWFGLMACPCSGNPSGIGYGCPNSSVPGGASLNGSGNASISADTAVLSTFGEKPTATSVVTQGPGLVAGGAAFGLGIRCAGSSGGVGLKRLYTKTASAGSISVPGAGDPSVHARSAAMGDPLSAGSVRYYYVYYRDPVVPPGCSSTSTFNSTDTLRILWRP